MPTGLRFAATDVPEPVRVAFTALGRALGLADDVRTEIAWSSCTAWPHSTARGGCRQERGAVGWRSWSGSSAS